MKNLLLICFLIILTLNAQKVSTDAYKKLPPAYKNWTDGDLNSAVVEFNKSAKNDVTYYNLGVVYYIKKEFDLAQKNLDLALRENDELARAMYYKGLAYMAVENYPEAANWLEKAIDEDDNVFMYYNLSKCYSFLGNTAKALENAKNAVSADNMFVPAQLLIVENLISTKKIDDALKLLNKIDAEMYPEADTYIKMGDLYQFKKDKNNAISSYKNYLHFYPQGKYAAMAKIKLLNYKISYDGSDVNPKKLTEKYHVRLGERFKYVVSYGFNLGEMTAKVDEQSVIIDNREHAKITFRVLSTSFLLPLDATYESYLDLESLCSSRTFMVNHSDGNIQENKMYVFDHVNHIFKARLTDKNGYIDYSEQELPVNTTDGTSILFYARGLIANKTEEAVQQIF